MPKPTENDWNSFYSMSSSKKIQILYEYTCLGYNMQEVADRNGLDDPRQVSVITRCYGFDNCRCGMFRNIGATEEDVAAFLRKYPKGCEFDGRGKTMREFLEKRVAERKKREENPPQPKAQSQPRPAVPSRQQYSSNDYADDVDQDETYYRSSGAGGGYGTAALFVIILLFLFRKKIFAFLGFLGGVFKILLLVLLAVGAVLLVVSLVRIYNPFGRGLRGLRFNFQLPNIVICVIMLLIGIGGILKGGSLIFGGMLCLIGIGALFMRR